MPEAQPRAADKPTVRFERRGAAAIIVLDRPEALNALSIGMRAELAQAVSGFGRDPSLYVVVLCSAVPGTFSVGGDVREMTGIAASDVEAARRGLADELRLCWLFECLWKPTVSFVDGRVMGTGVGIHLYNTHRVAGDRYRFSMPETQIGYFPDCGVAHAFSRMPYGIGLYLGLTGRVVGPADAYALGLVTHCIPASQFEAIVERLADADPIDPILDDAHRDPGPSALLADGPIIESYFAAPDLAGIMARLESADGPNKAFAAETAEHLRKRSPTALAVTDRMIRLAIQMDVREALIQDYRLAHRFVEVDDFREGVRAFLINKDGAPRWRPAKLEDLSAELVAHFFAPLGPRELVLAARSEMQAGRV